MSLCLLKFGRFKESSFIFFILKLCHLLFLQFCNIIHLLLSRPKLTELSLQSLIAILVIVFSIITQLCKLWKQKRVNLGGKYKHEGDSVKTLKTHKGQSDILP